MAVTQGIAGARDLTLVLDVDALERSALAKIDRVMLLALDALSCAGVRVVLAARDERERAVRLQRRLRGSTYVDPRALSFAGLPAPLLVVSDDPALLAMLEPDDRGIALGRPELASRQIAPAGDTSVRATLWWLLDERTRATAS